MPLSVIPFRLPEAAEMPPHLVESLHQMSPGEAVTQAMDLLLQIDAAHTILYEGVDGHGNLVLEHVASQEGGAGELKARLAGEPQYGQPPAPGCRSLAGESLSQGSALLVMGQAGPGEDLPLSAGLADHLFGGTGAGNAGFIYVLCLTAAEGRPLGCLTLLRPAAAGPLNHEQPNIAEGLRRILVDVLARAEV